MDDQFEDGPVCDFCEIAVDKGETLEPIYVGELPQPKPHRLTAVERKNRMSNRMRMLGHDGEAFLALYKALTECQDIDLNISNRVEEVKAVGGETQFTNLEHGSVPSPTEFESRTRNDKAGVSLKIRPKDVTYEPDAEVCDTCAEMFSSMSD